MKCGSLLAVAISGGSDHRSADGGHEVVARPECRPPDPIPIAEQRDPVLHDHEGPVLAEPAKEKAELEDHIVSRDFRLALPDDGLIIRGKHGDAEIVVAGAVQQVVEIAAVESENVLVPNIDVRFLIEILLHCPRGGKSLGGRGNQHVRPTDILIRHEPRLRLDTKRE